MRKALARLPIPISGVMLALLAMSNVMQLDQQPLIGGILRGIGVCLLGLLILKLLLAFESVATMRHNQAVVSTMATFPMALMLIATYLPTIGVPLWLARWFWWAVIGLALVVLGLYTSIVRQDFSINKMDPGWFTVYIGLIEVTITAPSFAPRFGQLVFWVCVVAYLAMLPGILKRVFILRNLPDAILPMTTILAAPFSIALAGYLQDFSTVQSGLFWILLAGCQFWYVIVIYQIMQMLLVQRLSFYPSYAAFTFPLAITATAITLAAQRLPILGLLAQLESFLAIIMCGFVLCCYSRDFFATKKA